MEKHLPTVDISLEGLAEKDHEMRKAAEKFAEANDIELKTFRNVQEMYEEASQEDKEVLVYDASPTQNHAENIYSSINHGLFHLAEKPPSMTREEHIKERKLAEEKDVFWKADFIERENTVVKKAVDVLEDEKIESIDVFRESSVGIQKLLNPVERTGVVGGDILDKMSHEIYLFDFLEAANENLELDFLEGEAKFFMPKRVSSDKMMGIRGGATETIDEETATARTEAKFSSGDIDITLHSSWIGCSKKAGEWEHATEPQIIESGFNASNTGGFVNEECRFFVVTGSRNILGDMLHGLLIDLDSNELIQTPDLMHDQLYRVLRRAIEHAADHRDSNPDADLIDEFMTGIFDAREYVTDNSGEFFEELQKSNERVRRLISDSKIIEDSETEHVTG